MIEGQNNGRTKRVQKCERESCRKMDLNIYKLIESFIKVDNIVLGMTAINSVIWNLAQSIRKAFFPFIVVGASTHFYFYFYSFFGSMCKCVFMRLAECFLFFLLLLVPFFIACITHMCHRSHNKFLADILSFIFISYICFRTKESCCLCHSWQSHHRSNSFSVSPFVKYFRYRMYLSCMIVHGQHTFVLVILVIVVVYLPFFFPLLRILHIRSVLFDITSDNMIALPFICLFLYFPLQCVCG